MSKAHIKGISYSLNQTQLNLLLSPHFSIDSMKTAIERGANAYLNSGGVDIDSLKIGKSNYNDVMDSEDLAEVKQYYIELVKYSVKLAASKDSALILGTDSYGRTALEMVKMFDIAEFLLGFDKRIVNVQDKFGKTMLYKTNDLEYVKLLIKNGAAVDITDDKGSTPLHHVQNPEVIELLVKEYKGNKANYLNAKDINGCTPLHYLKSPEAIKKLVELGADINIKDKKGMVPLDCCETYIQVKALVDSGGLDYQDKEVPSIFHTTNDLKIIETLLQAGIDPDSKDPDTKTRLHKAASKGDLETAQLLIKYNCDLNTQDKAGNAALHVCKNQKMANLLINTGADVNIKNHDGNAPIHCASNIGVIRSLLKANVDIEAKNNEGKNALIIHCNNEECISAFLNIEKFRKDASHSDDIVREYVNSKDNYGNTVLWHTENPNVVQTLIRAGADVNSVNLHEATPIFNHVNKQKTLKVFVENGASISHVDSTGKTPIYFSANEESIKLLIQNGAKVDITDNNGIHLITYYISNERSLDCIVRIIATVDESGFGIDLNSIKIPVLGDQISLLDYYKDDEYMVGFLLSNGAYKHEQTILGRSSILSDISNNRESSYNEVRVDHDIIRKMNYLANLKIKNSYSKSENFFESLLKLYSCETAEAVFNVDGKSFTIGLQDLKYKISKHYIDVAGGKTQISLKLASQTLDRVLKIESESPIIFSVDGKSKYKLTSSVDRIRVSYYFFCRW